MLGVRELCDRNGILLIADDIVETFENETTGAGAIGSEYTYSGHPVGAVAAVACLKETLRLNIWENAGIRGAVLHEGFLQMGEKHQIVGDVRGGHGLMNALELVSDRDQKSPVDKTVIAQVHKAIYEAGVMVRISGPNIILSPPLILNENEVQNIIMAIEHGLSSVSAG